MNKIVILAAFIFGMAHTVDAQLRTNTTTTEVVSKKNNEKIAALKSHIEALNTKEAWIKSNPEELKLANKNGWFAFADKTRNELKAEIAKIESKTK